MALSDWFIYAGLASVAVVALSLVSGIAARRHVRVLAWLQRDAWKLMAHVLGAMVTNVASVAVALLVLAGSTSRLGTQGASWFTALVAGTLAVTSILAGISALMAVLASRMPLLRRPVPSLLLVTTLAAGVPAAALLLTWGLGRQTLDWLYAELSLAMGPIAFWYTFRASLHADLEPW